MSSAIIDLIQAAFWETLYMVAVSSAVAVLVGVPISVALVVTRQGGMLQCLWLNRLLGLLVNIARAVPFIILMVAIIPFTRLLAGTSIGTTAAIVPLAVAAIPFMARVSENALHEVDPGLVTAARAMGATPAQIIWKVLLPEAMPGLVAAAVVTLVSLIGYSAMAGVIGGGGLGDVAVRYGYQRYQPDVMRAVVVVLVLMVLLVQSFGDRIVRRMSHR